MTLKSVITFDQAGNFYSTSFYGDMKDAILLTPETGLMHLKEQYKELFPDAYEPGDIVNRTHTYDNVQFIKLHKPPRESKIPAGIYSLVEVNYTPVLKVKTLVMDSYISLDNPVSALEADMDKFFANRDFYKSLGLKHRRGALLYGPPGNGKSLHIAKIVTGLRDVVTIYVPANFDKLAGITTFQDGLEGRNVVFIFEEITERTTDKDLKKNLLEFLDGDASWNNCYTIATTNYKEKLAANIANRPGRFDLLIEVNNPSESERERYMTSLMIEPPNKQQVQATNGLSIAHIREVILRSRVEDKSLEETIARMKAMASGKSFGRYT